MAATDYQAAQSVLLKTAALVCLLASYGRLKLGKEIKQNLPVGVNEEEDADTWLGYRPNAYTAIHGFNQGFSYTSIETSDFGMAIFYWHLSNRGGKLSRLELLGLANQLMFHASSVYEFRGLPQKVSAAFLAAIGGGAACQYLTQ